MDVTVVRVVFSVVHQGMIGGRFLAGSCDREQIECLRWDTWGDSLRFFLASLASHRL